MIRDETGEDRAMTDVRQSQEGWTGKWSFQAVPGLGHDGDFWGVFKRDIEMGVEWIERDIRDGSRMD